MSKPTKQAIRDAWRLFEEAEPDISTEQLLSRVRDHFDQAIDDDEIADAITEFQKRPGHG